VIRDRATWAAWRAFLCALFALPMSEGEAEMFRGCTGRATLPLAAFVEAWLICGRRAGKSFVLALVAVFLACFRDYATYLGPGERATVMVIATDRKQARVIFRYVRGLLSLPMLAPLIEHETAEAIDLRNSVTIEIHTASFRTTRGYTLAAVLCDELAFWRSDDSASPDYEVLDALRPGLGTLPGAMLLCASSPYAQSGAVFDAFRRYHGRDDAAVLVWRAPTRTMNPTYSQAIIDAALERDPAWATAEYLAEFRTDVETFIAREAVEACIERGVYERAPVLEVRYFAFTDPSGGASDSMTMAIAHIEKDIAVLDCVRERRAPFSPEAVVAEFATVLQSYRCSTVRGDRYAGEWPREAFRKHGIDYQPAAKSKSEIYLSLLPMINSQRCDLLDDQRLLAQLCGLERRVARGGRDSVDHRPGAHDDIANAMAGALASLTETSPADAWIEHARGQAERAQLDEASPVDDDYDRSARRGGAQAAVDALSGGSQKPAKIPGMPQSLEGNSQAEAYYSTINELKRGGVSNPLASPKCAHCGAVTGGTRITDHVHSWCNVGCQTKHTNERAAAIRAREIAENSGLPLKKV